MKVSNDLSSAPSRMSRTVRLATWAGLILVVGGGGFFYAWSGSSARRQATAAIDLLDAGRIDEAQSLVDQFAKQHAGSAETPFLQARLAYARKRPDEVLPLLAKARERGYAQPPMERLLGLVYAGAGRQKDAEPLLQQAWNGTGRSDPQVADALCRIHFQSYDFDQALKVANAWIKRDPSDLRALLWRAEIHTRNDPGPEVQVRDFDAILALDPTQAATRLARAGALRQLGRFDEAKRDYDLYLRAKPDDPEGLLGAAKTAEGLDDEDQALAYYDRALKLDPKNVVGLIGRASYLIRHKKYADALPLLDSAIKHEPNDPEPHYRKGQALDRMGHREEAEAEFAVRARLRTEQEQIEKIRKGLVRNPADVALMSAAAEWLLGHEYEEEGLDWAEKSLARDPGNRTVIRTLADYFSRKNQVGRANYYRLMLPAGQR